VLRGPGGSFTGYPVKRVLAGWNSIRSVTVSSGTRWNGWLLW